MFQIGFPASPCWCGVSAGECTHDSTYHTFFTVRQNGQREPGVGREDPRPTGRGRVALRNIIARFKVHSLCTQPGIRCTDPGRETFHINPANPQFKDSFSLYGYATWHPMIVTLVFNRPLAGIDHTTASFPCHSVTVLP